MIKCVDFQSACFKFTQAYDCTYEHAIHIYARPIMLLPPHIIFNVLPIVHSIIRGLCTSMYACQEANLTLQYKKQNIVPLFFVRRLPGTYHVMNITQYAPIRIRTYSHTTAELRDDRIMQGRQVKCIKKAGQYFVVWTLLHNGLPQNGVTSN